MAVFEMSLFQNSFTFASSGEPRRLRCPPAAHRTRDAPTRLLLRDKVGGQVTPISQSSASRLR